VTDHSSPNRSVQSFIRSTSFEELTAWLDTASDKGVEFKDVSRNVIRRHTLSTRNKMST
jgi:hypothetical protein